MATWPPLTHQDVVDKVNGLTQLLTVSSYDPVTSAVYSTTSTTMVDVDAANCVVSFTVPPSGVVLPRISTMSKLAGGGDCFIGIREGSTDTGVSLFAHSGTVYEPFSADALVTGLTPGASKTWKVAFSSTGGTISLLVGAQYSPLTFEIWGAL